MLRPFEKTFPVRGRAAVLPCGKREISGALQLTTREKELLR